MKSKNSLLLQALTLNAAFSTICALIMLLASSWIAQQLGIEQAMSVTLTAVFLALFALQLWNIVRTRKIRTWEIAGIIGGDLAWVAGSFVLIAIYHDSVSSLGIVLVDLVAFAVLFFAILQIRGLRESQTKVTGS